MHERSRKRQLEHHDEYKEYLKNWVSENKELHKEMKKDWSERNPEKLKVSLRNWQINNPDKVADSNKKRKYHKKHDITNKEWEECKKYFNHRCAYCDLKIEDHWIQFRGEIQLGDFHKEHVDDEGANDLSNCIPSCKSCNTSKHTDKLNDWYNERKSFYSKEREDKIYQWLNYDYKKYIRPKEIKKRAVKII